MVMEAVEKKPHIEDDTSPKSKREDAKEESNKEPAAKKKKPAKLDQCKKLICAHIFSFLIFMFFKSCG
jgi:hypothetical protein